jgi:curved DNA-binding protein CbpA
MQLNNLSNFNQFKKLNELDSYGEYSSPVGFSQSLLGRATISLLQLFKKGVNTLRLEYFKRRLENELSAGVLRYYSQHLEERSTEDEEEAQSGQGQDVQGQDVQDDEEKKEYKFICKEYLEKQEFEEENEKKIYVYFGYEPDEKIKNLDCEKIKKFHPTFRKINDKYISILGKMNNELSVTKNPSNEFLNQFDITKCIGNYFRRLYELSLKRLSECGEEIEKEEQKLLDDKRKYKELPSHEEIQKLLKSDEEERKLIQAGGKQKQLTEGEKEEVKVIYDKLLKQWEEKEGEKPDEESLKVLKAEAIRIYFKHNKEKKALPAAKSVIDAVAETLNKKEPVDEKELKSLLHYLKNMDLSRMNKDQIEKIKYIFNNMKGIPSDNSIKLAIKNILDSGEMNVDKAYKILGLEKGQEEMIKDRYKKLSMQYHPDKCKIDEEECTKRQQLINSAVETLKKSGVLKENIETDYYLFLNEKMSGASPKTGKLDKLIGYRKVMGEMDLDWNLMKGKSLEDLREFFMDKEKGKERRDGATNMVNKNAVAAIQSSVEGIVYHPGPTTSTALTPGKGGGTTGEETSLARRWRKIVNNVLGNFKFFLDTDEVDPLRMDYKKGGEKVEKYAKEMKESVNDITESIEYKKHIKNIKRNAKDDIENIDNKYMIYLISGNKIIKIRKLEEIGEYYLYKLDNHYYTYEKTDGKYTKPKKDTIIDKLHGDSLFGVMRKDVLREDTKKHTATFIDIKNNNNNVKLEYYTFITYEFGEDWKYTELSYNDLKNEIEIAKKKLKIK